MDEDEKADVLQRLLEMQAKLRVVVEIAEVHGRLADNAGAKGFALAAFMLRESLAVYSSELSDFVEHYLYGDE